MATAMFKIMSMPRSKAMGAKRLETTADTARDALRAATVLEKCDEIVSIYSVEKGAIDIDYLRVLARKEQASS